MWSGHDDGSSFGSMLEGVADRIRTGWAFTRHSLAMWREDVDLIFPPLLSCIVSFSLFGSVLWYLHASGEFAPAPESEAGSMSNSALLMMAAAFLGSYLISYVFGAMTVHLADSHLSGEDACFWAAIADAVKNLPAVLILAVVTIVVDWIEGILKSLGWSSRYRYEGRFGISLSAAMGARWEHLAEPGANWEWKVIACMMLPIAIVEDAGIARAKQRGAEIHKKGLYGIGIGEVGVEFFVKGMVWLLALLLFAGCVTSAMSSPGSTWIWLAVGSGVLSIAWSIGSYVRWSYYTMLYLYSIEREMRGANATMAGPLAIATGYETADERGLSGVAFQYEHRTRR